MGGDEFRELIRRNIASHGYHVTTVAGGGQTPRWMYTVGLNEIEQPELVLAGGVALLLEDARAVIDAAVQAARGGALVEGQVIDVDRAGAFRLEFVDASWARLLALGVFDIYRGRKLALMQLVPQGSLWTIDVPHRPCPTPTGPPRRPRTREAFLGEARDLKMWGRGATASAADRLRTTPASCGWRGLARVRSGHECWRGEGTKAQALYEQRREAALTLTTQRR